MTQTNIDQYRQALNARVIEISHYTRWRAAIVIENSADQVENVLQAADRELAGRTLESESATLRDSRAALRRMDEGRYGICEECDEPISPRRLAALPWTPLCLKCQEAADCRCAANQARPVFAMAA